MCLLFVSAVMSYVSIWFELKLLLVVNRYCSIVYCRLFEMEKFVVIAVTMKLFLTESVSAL